jgi:hypothetical protein
MCEKGRREMWKESENELKKEKGVGRDEMTCRENKLGSYSNRRYDSDELTFLTLPTYSVRRDTML